MAYQEAWQALHNEMPRVIPRTEYSYHFDFDLLEKVTGMKINHDSPENEKIAAFREFMKKWDISFGWGILVSRDQIREKFRTSMGHAGYQVDDADFNTDVHCPWETPEQVLSFDPYEELEHFDHRQLVKNFEEHYRQRCSDYPDAVMTTGIYVTMISGLLELFGWDMLLLAAGTDPVAFGKLAKRYEKWVRQFYLALADADIPVVIAHDDIVWTNGPFMSPQWYREYVMPAFKRLWAPVIESGKCLLYTSDGNYTEFFDDIVDAGAHGVVMEPCTDMELFAQKYGKTHAFIGNADTRVLLSGTKKQIRNEVERCVNIGRDCPGFIMAVGNHIPPNTPVENALYYNEVFEQLRERW